MGKTQDERREEVLRLQSELISRLTANQLNKLGDDLWGEETKSPSTESLTPPPGYPPIPLIDEKGNFNKDAPVPKTAGLKAPSSESKEAPVKEDIESLKKELHGYIGLENIKQETESLINLINIYKLRRENGLPCEDLSLHMVFSGNPGTGKTMIARLMSRIFLSLGLLSKGHLVEVDRSGLVAGFIGQTAIKTKEVLDKALGGVLFIDEAYSLSSRGSNDYGQEAIETLLKGMEDHRNDLVVIVAGYQEEMESFIASNPGLRSRFNRLMFFPDYSAKEMAEIFDGRCEKAGYRLNPGAKAYLKEILTEAAQRAGDFGNARGVRNLFERTVVAQSNRLSKRQNLSRENLMLLTRADLQKVAENNNPDIN